MYLFFYILKILIIVVPLLISVAYFTLAERKILGAIQRLRGPNVIGVVGTAVTSAVIIKDLFVSEPLSDFFSALVKEGDHALS